MSLWVYWLELSWFKAIWSQTRSADLFTISWQINSRPWGTRMDHMQSTVWRLRPGKGYDWLVCDQYWSGALLTQWFSNWLNVPLLRCYFNQVPFHKAFMGVKEKKMNSNIGKCKHLHPTLQISTVLEETWACDFCHSFERFTKVNFKFNIFYWCWTHFTNFKSQYYIDI